MGFAEIVFSIAMLLITIGVAIPLVGAGITVGEVRAARACFIVAALLLAFGEAGALLFDEKPILWRLATGALTGLAVFVALPEGLRWINHRQRLVPATLDRPIQKTLGNHTRDPAANPSNEARLFMECAYGGLPTRITGSGFITVYYVGGAMPGKLVTPYDERSSPILHWEELNGGWAAKCTFTNYSNQTLIDVQVNAAILTSKTIPNETGSGIKNDPMMSRSNTETFLLGKIDPGSVASVTVYFATRDKDFWYIAVTGVNAKFVGDDTPAAVKLQTNLKEPITLYPAQHTWIRK